MMPHEAGLRFDKNHVFCTVCSIKGRKTALPVQVDPHVCADVSARCPVPVPDTAEEIVSVAQLDKSDRRAFHAVATGALGESVFKRKASLKRLVDAGLVDSWKEPAAAKLTPLGEAFAASNALGEGIGGQVQIGMFDAPPRAVGAPEPAPVIVAESAPVAPAVESDEASDPWPTPDRWYELAKKQADRFWSKVDKSGDCWIWTAGRSSENYGRFQINEKGWRNGRPVQKNVVAHRLAWELTNGPVSDDLVVMHICDNPPCCNPAHLRPGTQGENVRDCADKGRIASGERHGSRTKPERVMRGATHYKATIGEDEVHKIRAMAAEGMRACDISRSLGVKVNIVRNVRDGRSWKSVPVAGEAQSKPLISWAGGKGKLLKGILPLLPQKFGRYFEPFAGGAALFFRLRPKGAYLADANPHLVRIYRAVRDHADDVIAAFREHKNEREYYDGVRADFNGGYGDDIWRAAALMYMNKAGFNGVCRFNNDGEYNVPFGDGEPKTLCDVDNIRACSALLQESTVEQADFRVVESLAKPGDLVFLDSPYLPEKASSFVKYTKDGFSAQDHADVAALFRRLAARGVHVLASNSDTPKARELYAGFEIRTLYRANSVNSKASARGGKSEILVLGGTWTPRGAS